MKNYSKSLTPISQQKPLPGQNMTKNNAGGYGFDVSPQERLERFLLIGSEGGTYYVSEQKLTEENATNVISYLKTDGLTVVQTVVNFAVERRAPKTDAGIFVLALAATYGDEETKSAAYNGISKVCQTATHLFTFLANVQLLRGWSRGLRSGVSKFYTNRPAEKVAYQMAKYRSRSGFTHMDALRLSHAKPTDKAMEQIFKYAVGKASALESGSTLINAFERAQTMENSKDLAGLISEFNLTWEMIPSEKLNDAKVLTALLENMPLTALMRNLNRFSYNDMTNGNTATVKTIVSRLTDATLVAEAGLHPVNVVNSMMTYASGRGDKGTKTWTPNQNIVDALSETFELALKALVPTGKNILLGVDVSGSMSDKAGGTTMSCAQIANVLAFTILKNEKNAEMVWFDTDIKTPTLGRRSSLDQIIKHTPNGGGTDCAQPFVHALKQGTKYDAILIFTDTETWAGPRHGAQLLEEYRRKFNRDVKVVEIALAGVHSSTIPDNDKNLLRVVGFDSSVVDVISQFLE